MSDDQEKMLKGVESFTYGVALLGASLALLLYVIEQSSSSGKTVVALIFWGVVSAPIHAFAHRAFALSVSLTFGLKLADNMTEGVIAFIVLVPTVILLAEGLGAF